MSTTFARISCSAATAAALRISACVGDCLRLLQLGADVLAHVDVGDVYREDFVRGAGVQAALEDYL